MVEIGARLKRRVTALITNMDQPLGNNIGNTLEVIEAAEILKGNVKGDLLEVSLALGSEMLVLGGIAEDTKAARENISTPIVNMYSWADRLSLQSAPLSTRHSSV
jgi:pyrimidine-nucleoside phosphorylase